MKWWYCVVFTTTLLTYWDITQLVECYSDTVEVISSILIIPTTKIVRDFYWGGTCTKPDLGFLHNSYSLVYYSYLPSRQHGFKSHIMLNICRNIPIGRGIRLRSEMLWVQISFPVLYGALVKWFKISDFLSEDTSSNLVCPVH